MWYNSFVVVKIQNVLTMVMTSRQTFPILSLVRRFPPLMLLIPSFLHPPLPPYFLQPPPRHLNPQLPLQTLQPPPSHLRLISHCSSHPPPMRLLPASLPSSRYP